MDPVIDGSVDSVKSAVEKEWLKVVRAEERSNLLKDLVKEGLGTDDVENFIEGQARLRFKGENGVGREGNLDRENVKSTMKTKLEKSLRDENTKRLTRNKTRARLERLLAKKKNLYKKLINNIREKVTKERMALAKKNLRKIRAIKMSRKKDLKAQLPKILERYANCRIFQEAGDFLAGEVLGPVIVGENVQLLSPEEIAVLMRGPKFTIRRVLSKERFMVEMEKAFVKIRWARRDDEPNTNNEEKTEEDKRLEKISEIEAAKSRIIFDPDGGQGGVVDFRNHRATDAKHNSRLILPGPLSQAQEAELVMRRVEWEGVFNKYLSEMCDEGGVQESNLTKEERVGLKRLKKRVGEGEIVVCSTDKSSRFAVLTMEEYILAGQKHVGRTWK